MTPAGNCGHNHVCWCVCQGVDIFEKDFLFLPIHDHLHWSLVIICHAGAPSEEDSCTPWILHLDSMTCECQCHLESANLHVSHHHVPERCGVPSGESAACRTVMVRVSQLVDSHLSLCSWSLHFED